MIATIFRPMPMAFFKGAKRRHADFGASYNRVIQELERELSHHGTEEVVIEGGFKASDIRIDGLPKGGSSPAFPDVRIFFESRKAKRPLRFECGTYHQWTDNFRAIVLTLGRLRLAEEHGVGSGTEQYMGFNALPSGIQAGEFATVEDAMRFLSKVGEGPGSVLSVLPADLQVVYEQAARKAHPDRAGGNGDTMAKVNRARDYIQAVLDAGAKIGGGR